MLAWGQDIARAMMATASLTRATPPGGDEWDRPAPLPFALADEGASRCVSPLVSPTRWQVGDAMAAPWGIAEPSQSPWADTLPASPVAEDDNFDADLEDEEEDELEDEDDEFDEDDFDDDFDDDFEEELDRDFEEIEDDLEVDDEEEEEEEDVNFDTFDDEEE